MDSEKQPPSSLPARRLSVDERRAQLLELGLTLFSEKNPDDISIDEIAAAAGISKGLLYHYFGSKRAYYVASVQVAADQLLEHTLQTRDDVVQDPAKSLLAGLDAYLQTVAERAKGFVMLVTSGTADPEVREVVQHVRRVFVARVLESLDIHDPPPVLRAALRGWIAYVETASLDWLEHGGAERAQLRRMLALSFLGILRANEFPLPQEIWASVEATEDE